MERKPKHIPKSTQRNLKDYISLYLDTWLKNSGIPNYTSKWWIIARDEAFKSNFHTSKVGCAIVYKNHVIGKGHNQLKTAPYQKRYNQKYRVWTNERDFSNTCGHTLHSEIDAITSIPYPVGKQVDWKKVKVYVYRICMTKETGYAGLALPCPACAAALSDIGIRKVYYTTGNLSNMFGQCDL